MLRLYRGAGQQLHGGVELKSGISIIVPTLDEGAVIRRLLQQLQAARKAGHEVILVDGGSRDRTREVAAPWVDRLLVVPANRGKQLHAGACAARRSWLWFVHADTRLPGDWLERMESACRSGQPAWGFFHVRLDSRRPLLKVVAWSMNKRSCLTRIATGDQGIYVHRALYFGCGGFRDLPIMEDIALSRCLRRVRPHCVRSPLTTSARRWERNGVVRTMVHMWRLRLAFWLGVPACRLARHYPPCSSPDTES